MIYKVLKKQYISKDCFVCGSTNNDGLYAKFYELENNLLVCMVTAKKTHQSYPGRVHGGIIAALLDETMGRAINISDDDTWGVTAEMTIKYKKPVPYLEEVYIVSKVTKDTRLFYETHGTLYLPQGVVGALATGKYVKHKEENIADSGFEDAKLYENDGMEFLNLPFEI